MSATIEAVSRASYVQRSMWASAQRYRASPLNVMTLAWRVRGRLRFDCLQGAMNDVVARHRTLRARLVMRDGQLLQEVRAPGPVPIETVAIAGSTTQDRLLAAAALLRDGGRNPIDVVTGPPLNVRLVCLDPNDHILCLYLHHAMCDGWSSQIIVRDLAALYAARCQGGNAKLPPLVEQYADSAEWQVATYESGGFAEEIHYWKSELADPPPALILPTTGMRKGNRDFLARSPLLQQGPDVVTALHSAARATRVSRFSILLAALAVLLHQRTGAEDLIVGVPTLNRWTPGAMEFVGCATSLLPARIRPRPSMTFGELCREVHATVRRLLAHGKAPLEVILRETQDSQFGGAVFPVWCQLRNEAPPITIDSEAILLHGMLIERGTLLAELDVDMVESDHALLCEFAHRQSLFDSALVDGLMADYGSIVRAATQQPDLTVARFYNAVPR